MAYLLVGKLDLDLEAGKCFVSSVRLYSICCRSWKRMQLKFLEARFLLERRWILALDWGWAVAVAVISYRLLSSLSFRIWKRVLLS